MAVTMEELQAQLTQLEGNKKLDPDTKKAEVKKIKRKIRKLRRGTNSRGEKVTKSGNVVMKPRPTQEQLTAYCKEVEKALASAGVKKHQWPTSHSGPKGETPSLYVFDVLAGFMLSADPEAYLEKFLARWDGVKPRYFSWGRQGQSPLLGFGPVTGQRVH